MMISPAKLAIVSKANRRENAALVKHLSATGVPPPCVKHVKNSQKCVMLPELNSTNFVSPDELIKHR